MRTRGTVARLGLWWYCDAVVGSPTPLALLLEEVVSFLPPETLVLVLRHLPTVELARLSCVHKAFHVAWRMLQEQHPGRRYAPPTAQDFDDLEGSCRLEHASAFGGVAVIQFMVAAGVDERGAPLLQAVDSYGERIVDGALWLAASSGHVQAVELLLISRADVHAANDASLRVASQEGHAGIVQLLMQHGADMHAENDGALRTSCWNGHLDVVQLLIDHGADVNAGDMNGNQAILSACSQGHADVVLLIQHGADVHAGDDFAFVFARRGSRRKRSWGRKSDVARRKAMTQDVLIVPRAKATVCRTRCLNVWARARRI